MRHRSRKLKHPSIGDSHDRIAPPSELLPLTQITVRLQGTRTTSRQALAAQLSAIAALVAEGRPSGQLEADHAGYVFRTGIVLDGQSIFADESAPSSPGLLRDAVARQLGQRAAARLDEMSAAHRAALERRFGFARQDSKKVRFLSEAQEQVVLGEAFDLLMRRSKAEQRRILKAIGLDEASMDNPD